jgi:hypothetical protein
MAGSGGRAIGLYVGLALLVAAIVVLLVAQP